MSVFLNCDFDWKGVVPDLNSVSDIWQLVLEKLRGSLSETTISTWFDDISALDLRDMTFYLSCPSDFKRSTVESLYQGAVRQALHDIFSADFEVVFLGEEESRAFSGGASLKKGSIFDSEEYTFDNFVVADCNKLAYAAARAVADAPAEHYNPLLIYGDSGLGKTHLIHAIAHELHHRFPKAKIVYVKSEEFTNDLIHSIGEGTNEQFRKRYRDADLFLMDDVQFIAGKKQVQEEFFNTFNSLYEAHRQIVLTSDRPPADITLLEDRLRTRFEGGLLVDVQPPAYETRLAIIRKKAVERGTFIEDDIAEYIAENAVSSVRQLEGMLNRILAYRDLVDKEMDKDSAARAVRDMMRRSNEYIPTAATIISEVAHYFGIDDALIKGPSRSKDITTARHVAIYLARKLTKLSTTDIGREVGDRDHTTVLNSLKWVESRMKNDEEFAQTVKQITININSKH